MDDVWQLIVGSSATQSVGRPTLEKVTVPVASPGSPAAERVSAVPYGTVDGAADSLNGGSALMTVKLAPVAVVRR